MGDVDEETVALAQRLYGEWQTGKPKSRIERDTWGDGGSHGRRFDRFMMTILGVSTKRRSKQAERIEDLERQVRSLGRQPAGAVIKAWERQLQHGREACLSALRLWNDPVAVFRTGGFSLLFVTAWNSIAIASIERQGGEWRDLTDPARVDFARDINDLVAQAFTGDDNRGLRENVRYWVDLRNAVAHRHLPALDALVIPEAQAGLLNLETALVERFGIEYSLGDSLSVPLQLSGFRNPDILKSLRLMQAALPPDVQSLLSRAETTTPELLTDPTFQLRVAFVPVVPASGRNPDAVAYFVKPGQVPSEVAETLSQYVVLPKPMRGQKPSHGAKAVVAQVRARTGIRFSTADHAAAARHLKVRPPANEEQRTLDDLFAEYFPAFKNYLYTERWIERLVQEFATDDAFASACGHTPLRTNDPPATAAPTCE